MKPKQRLLESEKDRNWRINTLKYWNESKLDSFLKETDFKLLEVASGKMNDTSYTFITNPFNLKDDKYKQYPAKLRNFDFISPLFLRWISEYKQRPIEPIVFTRNSNFDNEKLEYEKSLIDQSLQQRFINALMRTGAFDPSQVDETGQPVQEPMSPEVIESKTSSLKDLKTEMGQHAINYIFDKQELDRKYRKAFEYFIKINKCVTYKYVQWDEVMLQVISPLDIKYYGNRNITYLEDAEAITADYYMTYEEVLEIFQDEFDEYKDEYGDLASILEAELVSEVIGGGGRDFMNDYLKNRYGVEANRSISEDKRIQVKHIQWTSFRKVKRVADENGDILNLTEDYQGDDVIEEVWYPEEREGYVIGNRYFIGGYATDIQRVEVDNPFSTKKNYNGIIFLQGEVEQLTCPEKLYQYQEAYNVTQFKMQTFINRDLGNILALPIGLMKGLKDTAPTGNVHYTGNADDLGKPIYSVQSTPQSKDSVIAQNLYRALSSGILWVDDSADGFANAIQALKSINLSAANFIEWLNNRCITIKGDAEALLGFNSPRLGEIKTSEKVGNSNQNLISGSLVTEEYHSEFEEFLSKELQGLLDLSKYAFRVGKKAHYIRSNTDVQVLVIDEGFSEASYGIFCKSTLNNKMLRDTMMMQATQILQNFHKGGSTLVKLLANTPNYSEIAKEIADKEEEFFQNDQQNKQADRENQMQIAQMDAQDKEADRQNKIDVANINAEVAIAKAGLTSLSFNSGEGQEGTALAIAAETNKLIDSLQKNTLKNKEIESKEKIANENNKTKLAVSKDNVTIAVRNKN